MHAELSQERTFRPSDTVEINRTMNASPHLSDGSRPPLASAGAHELPDDSDGLRQQLNPSSD